MNATWELPATQTFNLGWDQVILLEGAGQTGAKLIFAGMSYGDEHLRVDQAPTR